MKNLKILLLAFTCMTFSLKAQNPTDIFTYRVGEYKISLLSEAQQNAVPSILIGASPEILAKYAPEGTFRNAMNALLVQSENKNILIDTGLGKQLFHRLYSLNVEPGDIDIILITHMHGDHIGGLIQNDKVMFPNAQIYIPQLEYDYWMSDEEMYQVPEKNQMSFTNARRTVDAYRDRLHLFTPSELNNLKEEIIPGFKAIAAYGHTPGHTGYLIESGNSKMFVWGDLTHAMAIQMPHPEIAVTYDVNPELAIQSRENILKFVKENYIPIAGMHIAYPGMGRITESPEVGYIYTPLQ